MDIILSHENADFDAIASLLAAHKLNPEAQPILPERLNLNVSRFLTLYQNGLPFAGGETVRHDTVTHVTLVDTQRLPKTRNIPATVPLHIIDHHPLNQTLEANQSFNGETVGAATTLLVEQLQRNNILLSSLEATLLLLGIYEDTGSLTYGTTTPRDHRAAAWLLEQNGLLDTVRDFLTTPLSQDQQDLLNLLYQSVETRNVEGHRVAVCSATVDHYVSEISSVAHRLRDMLDTSILFVVVSMPEHIQLVCRATVDAIDVGEIARLHGGGGHPRAAAAAIRDKSLEEVIASLWDAVYRYIQPITRVSELMSYSAHTVDSSKRISEIVGKLRRIGHEGYPVVENGKVIGLLTRRDLDRAAEHGLDQVMVREIMSEGSITLHPTDSIWLLEQRMVESGWGQIPVINQKDELIGIVTRTDLIKHWARIHPRVAPPEERIDDLQIEHVLGSNVATIIQTIAEHAHQRETALYMVGGGVRDLLLKRRNLDLDFVVESSAIDLANSLQAHYGGMVSSFRPFGTAKWKFDEKVATHLGLTLTDLPEHIDFATARNEFYEHPTALPTVYNSSIKLDLGRRDFTMNALAVQLSPVTAKGRILDSYGGLPDLRAGVIRVLHSLSFVDDPTRILRAVRFKNRLYFQIEPRTASLIDTAKPILSRITGERLRNEINLLLREAQPERGLRELETRGVLTAIHPSFVLPERLETTFKHARETGFPWQPGSDVDRVDLYWHLIGLGIPQNDLDTLCDRLLFPQHLKKSMLAARYLIDELKLFATHTPKPSLITSELSSVPEMALLAAWVALDDPTIRQVIVQFWTKWRTLHTVTNGNTLREMGLPPGPCYSQILSRLRDAWLDGEVQDANEENKLLLQLIQDGICRDL